MLICDLERPRRNRAAAPSEPLYTTTSHDGERYLSTEFQLPPNPPLFDGGRNLSIPGGIYQESEDRLFYPPNRKRSSSYYWAHVRRLCRLADVPVICPHSLRGLHATLALEGGATADSVAKALGHGSFAMTARHYATESSVLDAQSSRVSSALAAHPDSQIEWARLLKGLPAERLPELFVYLRTQCSAVQQLDDKPQT